jgi:hypothetical protein
LLDLSLWVSDLQRVYGRELVGTHLQRRELAVSGLRRPAPFLAGPQIDGGGEVGVNRRVLPPSLNAVRPGEETFVAGETP